MTVAHLVCGAVGAGKTTYAHALASRLRAVCFNSDEWMTALFAGDVPRLEDGEWAQTRVDRCEGRIWDVASQLLALGTSVVLDVDLSAAATRDLWRTRIAGTPASSKLHVLDVGRDTRLLRIQQRNRRVLTSDEMTEMRFNRLDIRFEPPTDDELYGAMILCED